MVNVLLTVRYDGSGFAGWQRQKNAVSVQEVLESAFARLLHEDVTLVGASRTDSGVHASGQKCSFKVERLIIPPERLPYAMNSVLGEDVSVINAEIVPPEFHPRFSAKKKTYEYKIYNGRFNDPLLRRYCWHVRAPLDAGSMTVAARHFIGSHDFTAFCASGSGVSDYTRTIYDAGVTAGDGLIAIRATGDGFLYNMVRIMAGTLVYVGLGKFMPEDVIEIISSRDRSRAGATAPPHGLTLLEITY